MVSESGAATSELKFNFRLVALQETEAPWRISSVLAGHGAVTWDRAGDRSLPKWQRAVSCTGHTSAPHCTWVSPAAVHKKKFCFCTKQSWVPTKVPPKLSDLLLSAGCTKPHEQATAGTSPSTRESNTIHSKQEGKTKIIPSLQDNPLLSYINSVVIVTFTHKKPHRIQDKLPHPTASASRRHKQTLIKHLNVNITNPKWNRWGRKNAKICLVFQCPVFWLDA